MPLPNPSKNLHFARCECHLGLAAQGGRFGNSPESRRDHPPRNRTLAPHRRKKSPLQLRRTHVLENISRTASLHHSYFFFQAEDGIRDLTVTGVQTCALPISCAPSSRPTRSFTRTRRRPSRRSPTIRRAPTTRYWRRATTPRCPPSRAYRCRPEIGRASCRERV